MCLHLFSIQSYCLSASVAGCSEFKEGCWGLCMLSHIEDEREVVMLGGIKGQITSGLLDIF